LYWLSRYPGKLRSVFDYGGHVGILYYGFARYLSFDEDFKWTVCDVPEVTRAGEQLANERDASQISFSNDLEDVQNGCDVLLASGSLQYLEEPFYETLKRLDELPRHIVINMLPLHEQREFVTVSSMDASYCAYKVYHLATFLGGMRESGWKLKDSWENPGKSCPIPFHEELSNSRYRGMYYVRA
jgi:putative methyltransferase (TIGR04325 family)